MAFNNFENEIFDSASDGNGHAGNRNAAMPVIVNLLGEAQEVDTSQSAIQVDTTTSDEVSGLASREAEPETPNRDQRQGQVQLHEFIGAGAVQQYQPQTGGSTPVYFDLTGNRNAAMPGPVPQSLSPIAPLDMELYQQQLRMAQDLQLDPAMYGGAYHGEAHLGYPPSVTQIITEDVQHAVGAVVGATQSVMTAGVKAGSTIARMASAMGSRNDVSRASHSPHSPARGRRSPPREDRLNQRSERTSICLLYTSPSPRDS